MLRRLRVTSVTMRYTAAELSLGVDCQSRSWKGSCPTDNAIWLCLGHAILSVRRFFPPLATKFSLVDSSAGGYKKAAFWFFPPTRRACWAFWFWWNSERARYGNHCGCSRGWRQWRWLWRWLVTRMTKQYKTKLLAANRSTHIDGLALYSAAVCTLWNLRWIQFFSDSRLFGLVSWFFWFTVYSSAFQLSSMVT